MYLPTIPTERVDYAATYATCDGSGLVTIPTADGPEHFACLGCSACRTPVALTTEQTARRRASALAAAFAAVGDDEGAF